MPDRLSHPLRSHRSRFLSAGSTALGLLLACGPALAVPPPSRGKAKDLTAPPTAQPVNRGNAPGEPHRLTTQLNALGAVSCLGRAEQIARFLDPNNVAAVAVMPLATYPNQRLVTANLAIPKGDGSEALAIISLTPNQANGCGASYQLRTTEPGSCVAALKARQAEPRGAIPLGGRTIRIQRLAQDSVFLGWQHKDLCLIVKQQTLIN